MDLQDVLTRIKQFTCTINGKTYDVYTFTATESLFSLYRVELTAVSEFKPDVETFIQKDATLTLSAEFKDREFQGTVTQATECPKKGRFYLFKIVITPHLWQLTQMRDIRIFQNLKTPDIIKDVLDKSGILSIDYEFRLRGKYSPRDYCVQYRETNMDFITRLMAEEGMFYYHEIKDGRHFLVFGDDYSSHKPITGVPVIQYSEKGQLTNREEVVTFLAATAAVTSGKVQLRDYDFTRPSYKPTADAAADPYKHLELYDYPGNLIDPDTGYRLSNIQLERETRNQKTLSGKSVCRRLSAGHTFTVQGRTDRDSKDEYLITAVTHSGRQPQSLKEQADSTKGSTYKNTFTCTPTPVTFRPERPPIKPSVTGVQTAVVTGPKSEEIFTDEYGRVLVRFHWDRKEESNTMSMSSCWLRVAQPWAGAGFGALFIPRIGQEVVVSFIDGDPDRPIITGSVYNGRNLPPVKLPADKTRSTIRTETSPYDGGGFNELRFEDLKGQEEIYIHGQKDWNIEILNDKSQTIGHDEKLDVKNDRVKTVGHDQKEEVKNDKFIAVDKNHTESVGENMSVKIGKNFEEHTAENKTVTVEKNLSETVSENADIKVEKNRSLTVNENSTVSIDKNHTERIGHDLSMTAGENGHISIGKDLSIATNDKTTISSGKEIVLTCGSATLVLKSDGKIQINGQDIHMVGDGNVVIKGQNIAEN